MRRGGRRRGGGRGRTLWAKRRAETWVWAPGMARRAAAVERSISNSRCAGGGGRREARGGRAGLPRLSAAAILGKAQRGFASISLSPLLPSLVSSYRSHGEHLAPLHLPRLSPQLSSLSSLSSSPLASHLPAPSSLVPVPLDQVHQVARPAPRPRPHPARKGRRGASLSSPSSSLAAAFPG